MTQKVQVDSDGFIRVDGVVMGRMTPEGAIRVKDKDRRRSSKRGSEFVEVRPSELDAAINKDSEIATK